MCHFSSPLPCNLTSPWLHQDKGLGYPCQAQREDTSLWGPLHCGQILLLEYQESSIPSLFHKFLRFPFNPTTLVNNTFYIHQQTPKLIIFLGLWTHSTLVPKGQIVVWECFCLAMAICAEQKIEGCRCFSSATNYNFLIPLIDYFKVAVGYARWRHLLMSKVSFLEESGKSPFPFLPL